VRVLVVTDDRVGPVMAGTALRAWELSRVLLAAGHEVVLAAAVGSTHPEGHGPPVVSKARWRGFDAVVGAPWSLPPWAFIGSHLLVVDGATPLLAELAASPPSPAIQRRRRTAAARLPLVAARADAVLAAGSAQVGWWRERLFRRVDVPVIDVPFGIPDVDPPPERDGIEGVPHGWSVVLWWGGVWPWLDLDTLLAARAKLGSTSVSVVVPTAPRPGSDSSAFSTADLLKAARRHGLQPPAVVPLESWAPYAERHRVLNNASLLAVLHHPGLEADLSFRTRALDGLWAGVPMLVSEGGAVAELARIGGWGGVVPTHAVDATAAAMDLLLGRREQERCRRALAAHREAWRWSLLGQPVCDALTELPVARRHAVLPAAVDAAAVLLGRHDPVRPPA
jgi:glycosyltransferase involved in cell wall biosynthesis